MNTISRIAIIAAALSFGAAAAQASPAFIKDSSAKQLVKKAVLEKSFGGGRWNVSLKEDVRRIGFKQFTAIHSWGPGMHPMVMVPNYRGLVDMNKGKGAATGMARVQFQSP